MSAPRSPHSLSDWMILAAPGFIWGASFLFIAEALEAMPPNAITFTRLLIGFTVLSTLAPARRPILREDWGGVFWVAVLWMAFPLSMFPLAEQHISSALAGMLNGANPLFVVIVSALMAKRLPARPVALGLLVGMTGAVMIAWPGLGAGGRSAFGVGLVVAALVSYGVALNLARPLQLRNGGLPVVWRALGISVLLTAPLGAPELMHARFTWRVFFCMLALGGFGTAIAQVFMAKAAGLFGAPTASGTTFLTPVVALLLGVIVRGEKVALVSAVGCFVCLLGAWLISRPDAPG